MNGKLTLEEIDQQLTAASAAFSRYCDALPDKDFFYQPEGKWSPALQVRHLIISARNTRLAYALPKFVIRWYAGKPNRPSRTYDELAAKYSSKLEQGGKASGRFIPKPVSANYGKQNMMEHFKRSMEKLGHAFRTKWKDPQLDQYIAPHPLLGKITLRELGYFTVHHTYHHLESIKKMTA